mmetsp:Transcript_38559/g.46627  ORF Transcript_38559/g.46627 Transcript_38559/m.46627 type:complete len:385 (+) Transcript_38559:121-1275(+)|eukprot:CAMPEP_0197849894 /NCGR_PEP_ID=MMETSP1438-20131217/13586_1 /TAXON_ID=1461541 /ORGANISM="Pterosperma sp., Strain CCMP1384" /LENGTH=384 /DNA_ID=CAMNT_0043462789 /DNA_START=92 /DNA_END=1246 /DNA_ORIENTATION=+
MGGYPNWTGLRTSFLVPSVKEGEVDNLSKFTEGIRHNTSTVVSNIAQQDLMTATERATVDLEKSPAVNQAQVEGRQQLFDGLTFGSHMIAGAIAGMTEHTAMYPIDTIKTRLQIASEASTSMSSGLLSHSGPVRSAFRQIFADGGILGLYRGINAMALGAGPAHAVYFAVYEKGKEYLNGDRDHVDPARAGVAGVIATCAHDAVFLPMDVVKQRLQIPNTRYAGVWDCYKTVMAEEGVGAFFRSYRTTVVMNIPYTAVHFAVYESAKTAIGADTEDGEDKLSTHLLAGGAAGGIAAAITNPMDVVKTRLQTQGATNISNTVTACSTPGCGSSRAPPISDALRQIAAKEGTGALFKGISARVLFHTPAAAICWSTYEYCKSMLAV